MNDRHKLQIVGSAWDDEVRADAAAFAERAASMLRAVTGNCDPEGQRERCVIGTLLLHGCTAELKAQALEAGLVVECFIDTGRRAVWGAVLDLEQPDAIDVCAALRGNPVAAAEVFACVAQASVPGQLWQDRVRAVVRRWKVLKAQRVAGVIAEEPGSVEGIRQTAQAGIVDFLADDERPQTDNGTSLWDELQDRHDGKQVAAPSLDGDAELRVVWPTLEFGRFYVLGARPKMGKSIVALQQAWSVAKAGHAVCVISCEMTEREQLARVASMETGINTRQILGRDKPSVEQMGQLWDAKHRIDAARFRVYSPSKELPTLEWVGKCVRASIARWGRVDLVVLDYAQKVAWTDRKLQMNEHVSQVSAWCKNTALQGPAVIAAAQIKQLPSGQKWPTRNDLANSDALLRDADAVYLLHRPDAESSPGNDPDEARFRGALSLAGSRTGGEGVMSVRLLTDRSMFTGDWGT